MKSKTTGFILIYVLSILLLLSIVYLPNILHPRGQAIDFRGYVENIKIDSDKNMLTIEASYINSEAKAEIKAASTISCRYLDGRAFPIHSLKKGDMIDLDYKGHWGLNKKGIMKAEAKWLTVCPLN